MKITKHNQDGSSKLAVVTRAKDDYDMAEFTHPVLKEYAQKCKADFIVINENIFDLGHFSFELFQCYDLFKKYDRILSIDSDAITTPWCPNLFEVVPYEKIGVIYEDKLTRRKNRRRYIRMCQEQLGDVGWEKGYINTGTILLSECHKNVLTYTSGQIWDDLGYDDILIGYNIHKYGHKVYELSYKYNHMSMFSEIGYNWLKSNIIHYAGRGFTGKKSRAEQLQSDLKILQSVSHPFWLNFYYIPQRMRLIAIGILNFFRYK